MKIDDVNKIKVLIIDRHEAVRQALSMRLRVSQRLNVVGAVAEPDEARPFLLTYKPDVVLLGLQNGSDEELIETAFAVRDLTNNTSTVIVLAPYADAIEREVLLQAGAKRYLLKHINSPKLIAEIESVAAIRK